VAISDTHNFHDRLPLPPPASAEIDVLVHGGDFSNVGDQEDVDRFTNWIRAVNIKFKVAIAGNHDTSFDEALYLKQHKRRFQHQRAVNSKAAKAALTAGYHHSPATADNPFPEFDPQGGVAYLEDSGISIQGIRIWGSPWQPEFYDWGFNLPPGAPLREKWALIPSNTEVLITHGPPLGHGDLCLPHRNRAGCVDLLAEISERIHPRFHVFGHIHEGYGQTSNGETEFINASSCNLQYDRQKLNKPIVFDVPLPGHKQEATPAAAAAAAATTSEA
jgi:Icc-related predicted phosphoesterase